LIEVSDLRVRYGSVEAVAGISFRVERGQICGYLGPNGAGKSSTVKALTGILRPEAGSVQVAGFDLATARLEAQRRLGYVPENAATYAVLTGAEMLELIVELYELDRDTAAAKSALLLDRFDLAGVADRPIATYSKGQRQKIVLLSALLHDPEVLILDEPLNGLDAHAVRTVKELLQGHAGAGCTILFCSHYLEVVERLCERVIILHQGRIVADAPTAELVSLSRGHSLEAVFSELTEAPQGDVAEIVRALRPQAAQEVG
jgi:ABC-2 type transport system ATP-binding protein